MPRQKGAHTLSRGGMLAGRIVRCPRLCGLQGQVPGAYGGFVCQHHRRGQGADRYLLHFVECPEGRGVDPGRPPRHLRARPQPGRLHQEADRPREYGDLGRGPCHVHEEFSLEKLLRLKKEHPAARIVVHPECRAYIIEVADFVGSTAAILDYCGRSGADEFIVVTESASSPR